MFKITLIACGNKMPTWVNTATTEYSRRLGEYVSFQLLEIPLLKRGKSSDLSRIMEKEAQLIHAAIPQGARIIALDMTGESFTSEKFALKFDKLQQITNHIALIIGGPEGLAASTLARSQETWSLSKLTLAHPLVRIVLLEAMYRAWAILNNHPYHK